MSYLSKILKKITEANVGVIYIRDIDFGMAEEDEIKELALLIQSMKTISVITFQNVNIACISIENLNPIFEAIQNRQESLEISLVDNNLGAFPEKFLFIMNCLIHSNISKLDLSSNNLFHLTEDILDKLKLLASEPNLTLKALDLSDNKLGQLENKGLVILGQYLVSCKQIISLQLHHNTLGANPFSCKFLELLYQLPLEEMGLVGNELCDLLDPDKDNGEKAVRILALHPTLSRLNLADNLLGACGAEHLSLFIRYVSQHNRLKKIDLTVNQFDVLREDPKWNSFLNNFATFIAGAPYSGLEVVYNYGNFDDESKGVLMEMVERHKALMSPLSFFGNTGNAEIPAVSLEIAAEEIIAILKHIPTVTPLLKNREQFRALLEQLNEVLLSKTDGSDTTSPPSAPDGIDQVTLKAIQ